MNQGEIKRKYNSNKQKNEIKKYIKISFDTNYCLLMKNIIIKQFNYVERVK